jgi:hypothetical protein
LLLQADTMAGGMLTDEGAREVESLVPQCTRVRLAGAGHLLQEFRSQEALTLVHKFPGSPGPSGVEFSSIVFFSEPLA